MQSILYIIQGLFHYFLSRILTSVLCGHYAILESVFDINGLKLVTIAISSENEIK